MESLFWLAALTQGLVWFVISVHEARERRRARDRVLNLFRIPICYHWVDGWTGKRFFRVKALTRRDTINALLASSTFEKLTQEEHDDAS